MTRPAYVDPSALSPSEHEAYSSWVTELEQQLRKLSRGLRFGEMLGFIRKRTMVDREGEIMAFLSPAQQQNLGVGEFIAILRLTSPLVLTNPLPSSSSNPFCQTVNLEESPRPRAPILPPPKKLTTSNLQEIATTKKRAPPPPAPPSLSKASTSTVGAGANVEGRASPLTPLAGSNPFRRLISPQSGEIAAQHEQPASSFSPQASGNFPPTPPESTFTAKSPPLPPRPAMKPVELPPKHVSQQQPYQKLNDPTATPTTIRPYTVPAVGPTSIDIISSSSPVIGVQRQNTGQSNASSTTHTRLVHQNTGGNRKSSTVTPSLTDSNIRLLGSSHIGINSMKLRTASPFPGQPTLTARNSTTSSSSEESTMMLHKNRSDSSLSSLSGMLPRPSGAPRRGDATSSIASTSYRQEGKEMSLIDGDQAGGTHDEEILSSEYTASPPPSAGIKPSDHLTRSKTLSSRNKPPLPPLPRRRPESLYVSTDPTTRSQKLVFGAEPTVAHPSPFHATSISSSSHYNSGSKQRTNSAPGHQMHHGRSASLSSAGSFSGSIRHPPHSSSNLSGTSTRAARQHHSESLHRPQHNHASSNSSSVSRPIDLFHKGRDVSQEWLEKARAGMKDAAQQSVAKRPPREDRTSLMYEKDSLANDGTGGEDAEDGEDGSDGEEGMRSPRSVQERRRELERLRTEVEPGWSRLE